jgi:hypothetical protein
LRGRGQALFECRERETHLRDTAKVAYWKQRRTLAEVDRPDEEIERYIPPHPVGVNKKRTV